MILEVLKGFGLDHHETEYNLFGGGLINNTWKVSSPKGEFILQQINTDIFPVPGAIIENIINIKRYLEQTAPEYFFVGPIKTKSGHPIFSYGGFTFRLFPFVKQSMTIDKVEQAQQAFEASRQFGKFSKLLTGYDASGLNISLKNFHDLNLRVSQYNQAIEGAEKSKLKQANWAIAEIEKYVYVVKKYRQILNEEILVTRIFHHDTKISNVLLHAETGLGICVIDLDTVMPGYFISDVGDMMRTYLCPVTEEEIDFELIDVRLDVFESIFNGYMSEMEHILTTKEQSLFVYAGQFMIFMQAIRFLTDFLNGDIYYGAAYPNHNLNRSLNQIHLLNKYSANIPLFEKIIQSQKIKNSN